MDRAAIAGGRRVSGHSRFYRNILRLGYADRAGLGVDRAALFRGIAGDAAALVELDPDGAGAIHRAAVT